VVGNQCLGKAGSFGVRKHISKSIYKVIAIGIICKYFFYGRCPWRLYGEGHPVHLFLICAASRLDINI